MCGRDDVARGGAERVPDAVGELVEGHAARLQPLQRGAVVGRELCQVQWLPAVASGLDDVLLRRRQALEDLAVGGEAEPRPRLVEAGGVVDLGDLLEAGLLVRPGADPLGAVEGA